MELAALELVELVEGQFRVFVGLRADGEGDEDLIDMEPRVVVAEVVEFQLLDGLDDLGGDEVDLIRDAGEFLQRVQQHGGGGAEQRRGLAGDDGAVVQLDGSGHASGQFGHGVGGGDDGTVLRTDVALFHEEFDLLDGFFGAVAPAQIRAGGVVPADDLLLGGLTDGVIVEDAVAGHVDTHIGGRFIRALTVDLLVDAVQDREDLDVAVVVDGGLAVGFEVERVDHVDVVQVGGGSLIGEVDRVLQRDVPDGERLELRVTGVHSPLVLLVELGEADGHLSAAGAGGRDDDEGLFRLDVFVLAVAFIGEDERDIAGVAGDRVMAIHLDAEGFEALLVCDCLVLAGEPGQDDRGHVEAVGTVGVDEAQGIHVIGDAEVAALLVLFDVARVDDHDDFRVIFQLGEHPQFTVRLKAGQYAHGMVVVEDLAAELEVQLAAGALDAFLDVGRLQFQIFVVVESDS